MNVQRAPAGERPGGKQKRIAGQERRDDQARLAKDDGKQNRIRPDAVVLKDGVEVRVEVKEQVDQVIQQFHASAAPFPLGQFFAAMILSASFARAVS